MTVNWAKSGRELHKKMHRTVYIKNVEDPDGPMFIRRDTSVKDYHAQTTKYASSVYLCLDCNHGMGMPKAVACELRECMDRGHSIAWYCAEHDDVEQAVEHA